MGRVAVCRFCRKPFDVEVVVTATGIATAPVFDDAGRMVFSPDDLSADGRLAYDPAEMWVRCVHCKKPIPSKIDADNFVDVSPAYHIVID